MTYKTGRSYLWQNTRLETLIEALDDLQAHTPAAYTQRIALLHIRLRDAHASRRTPRQLLAFLYAPWSEEE